MFALADCNNFFVSCERAFQPDLEGKPLVVLSNNDGCVVARSNESKAMGIAMGTPFFKVRHLVDAGKLWVRSSNYALYGDLSSRVMTILASEVPKIEVYSIDEAYLIVDGISMELLPSLCSRLIYRVRKCTGIPISIGIAETRTLAKVANHFAKKYPGYRGVCAIRTVEQRLKALELTPVDDVWGIGRRVAPRLVRMGIRTALDFVSRPESFVSAQMGVNGVRTWKELQGISCIGEEKNEPRQSICTSRSFADTISDFKELSARVSDFAAMCAAKLRKDGTAAECVCTFLLTNRFREDQPQDYPDAVMRLDVPGNSTPEIVGAALDALRLIWKPGFEYKKAGVTVFGIVRESEIQGTLFGFDDGLRLRRDKISEVMDKVNVSGRNVLRMATQRPGHYADGIRKEHCSRPFSTSWNDILEVH
ncbi:MAG: Y-family DNA polymerase [Candidatus Cryptobacteroides sp.]